MQGVFHRNLKSTWLFFTALLLSLLKLIRHTQDRAKSSFLQGCDKAAGAESLTL